MTWARRFRLRESLFEGLWLIPVIAAVFGGILGFGVSVADEHIGTPSWWQYSPSTASTVLTAIVGATAAITGFVVTVTVLVVQMLIGTFSARIMRLWFRDPILKVTLAFSLARSRSRSRCSGGSRTTSSRTSAWRWPDSPLPCPCCSSSSSSIDASVG